MDLPKVYNPKETESKWYKFWLDKGLFHSKPSKEKAPFTIVIPPPNITGILTMGHVLNNTLQDILIRWKKMAGYESCWIPGTDHAGIATQNVVEKELAKKNISKRELGREKFIERIWQWKEEYGNTIIKQLKQLGCSCDWSRERFTLDEGLSNAVKEVFVRLYNKGLIYKGKYIVNWCPRCCTALSDDEVDHREHNGSLWYIKYPLKQTSDTKENYIVVATTRPETMLGDTAVAVNPGDKRYKNLIGKTVILPLVNREIPIIADDFVDPEFGTGLVKVTPAHDANDFQIGLRHKLDRVVVFDTTGKMNKNAPSSYQSLDRYECRDRVVDDLKTQGLLLKIEKHTHAVGHCYRCDSVIEPYLSDQWFVKMAPLAEKALKVVLDGKIKFYPDRWVKVYQHWMENIRDWCISRQLWWGHRIPVYYCKSTLKGASDKKEGCGPIVAAEKPDKCPECGNTELEQDTDVLDTWFSSWLWPFSTLNWPKENNDLKYFYPTGTLVTGPDIIFFWVARMIMAGLEFMNDIPFSKVYFTSMVRDLQGRKMSKSLGNSPDPLDIIDEYGADTLRFTIVYLSPVGQDVLFSKEKCGIGRNFCNKIWNASRFIMMNLDSSNIKPLSSLRPQLEIMDKWIISEYNHAVQKTTKALDELNFTAAAHIFYDSFWFKFCDWYLELVKPRLTAGDKSVVQSVLVNILDGYLKLLHPIMPYITEEIHMNLLKSTKSILECSWPVYADSYDFPEAVPDMEFLIEVIENIRIIRSNLNVPPKKLVEIIVNTPDNKKQQILQKHLPNLRLMTKIEKIHSNKERPSHSAIFVVSGTEIYLSLAGIIDLDKEKKRLEKTLDKLSNYLKSLETKLKNQQFLTKAPKQEIEKTKLSRKETEEKIHRIKKLGSGLEF